MSEREAFEAWAIEQPYIAAKNLWDERSRYGAKEYENHEVELMWEAWQSRAAVQAAQPEAVGWRLVPVEPTVEMNRAAFDAYHATGHAGEIWRAMLSSAPTPEPMSAPTAEPVHIEREAFDEWFRGEKGLDHRADTTGMDAAWLPWRAWKARAFATPPSAATPEPSDAERLDMTDVLETLAIDIEAMDLMYRGDPKYEHDGYYMRKEAARVVRDLARRLETDDAIRATKGGKP